MWRHDVTAAALVLGSTTPESVADRSACDAVGAEVVRRRSGGGAVWLAPGEVVWVDVIVPAGSPGWTDDVRRSMVWFGERVRDALAEGGLDVEVHRSEMSRTPWSNIVCFDGLAPGELVVGDAKIVGLSQRRVRRAARFQCCWYTHYEHAALTGLLTPTIDPTDLRPVATVDRELADALPVLLIDALNDAESSR